MAADEIDPKKHFLHNLCCKVMLRRRNLQLQELCDEWVPSWSGFFIHWKWNHQRLQWQTQTECYCNAWYFWLIVYSIIWYLLYIIKARWRETRQQSSALKSHHIIAKSNGQQNLFLTPVQDCLLHGQIKGAIYLIDTVFQFSRRCICSGHC